MSDTSDLHPLSHLSTLERDTIEGAVDRALRAMKQRSRRDMLLFLLDFPGSTVADLTRGLGYDAEKNFNILRRAGMIAPVPPPPKTKAHPKVKRLARYRVSPYGVRWLRTLYGKPDLESDAIPRA